jgi:hypothetical protein
MKIRKFLAAGALTMAFAVTGLAQHMHGENPKQDAKPDKASGMMGKPTAEQTVDGVRIQLWVITQDEHKKIMQDKMKSEMGGMKHDMMGGATDTTKMEHDMGGEMKGMDHSKMGKETKAEPKEADHSKMMEGMMAGTHHVMVKVLDDKSGKAVGEGHIMVAVTAPSGKSTTIHLTEMMDHFGGGASLTEKGSYKFALSFKAGSMTHKAEFEYNAQ